METVLVHVEVLDEDQVEFMLAVLHLIAAATGWDLVLLLRLTLPDQKSSLLVVDHGRVLVNQLGQLKYFRV